MEVSIVKVNGIIWDGEADSVVVPGAEGELTVLPNHVPLVTALKAGYLVVKKDGEEVFTDDIERGMLEVTGSRVSILL